MKVVIEYTTSSQPGDCLHWGLSPFYTFNPLGLPAYGMVLPLFKDGLVLPLVNPLWKPRSLLYYLTDASHSKQVDN